VPQPRLPRVDFPRSQRPIPPSRFSLDVNEYGSNFGETLSFNDKIAVEADMMDAAKNAQPASKSPPPDVVKIAVEADLMDAAKNAQPASKSPPPAVVKIVVDVVVSPSKEAAPITSGVTNPLSPFSVPSAHSSDEDSSLTSSWRSPGKAKALSDVDKLDAGLAPAPEIVPDPMHKDTLSARPPVSAQDSAPTPSIEEAFTDNLMHVEECLEAFNAMNEEVTPMSKPRTRRPVHKISKSTAAARKSARNSASSAASVMEKAMSRKADQNNTGKPPRASSFCLLSLAPDSHFLKVANDAHVIFRPEKGSPAEQLSAIRAQELVQASLAEAEARRELARLRAKEAKVAQSEAAPSSLQYRVLTRAQAKRGLAGLKNLTVDGAGTLSPQVQ
jgi:hypothetical protein